MFFFWCLFLWIKFGFFFEWVIFSMNSCSFSLIFLFDWVSLFFMSFVFLISGCVLFYSIGYMAGDLNLVRFFYLVFFFILSMIFFILMPDLICLLLGWDGLGLVSYCLVIYYQNKSSLSSGLVTVFMNRFGDVFLIMSIGWFFNFNSFHFFDYIDFFDYDLCFFVYLLFFASFTKSAQFPFSFWLPSAMAAPTPVSSLVHSSTLVTSGVYLIIRFSYCINYFDTFFLMVISLMTMFLSGLNACVENDLKKIIAFSTLSQLGFMFFILSFGSFFLCFLHLLIHAVFKSLLFLCSGFFIHCFFGNQDIRFMGGICYQCPYVSSCFCISLLCLCGFPFFSGFYSKDFVLEMLILSEMGFFFFFFFWVSGGLTMIYKFRLIYYLFFSDSFFFLMFLFFILFMYIFLWFFYFFFLCWGVLFFFWLLIDFVYGVDFYLKYLPLLIFLFFSFISFNFLAKIFFFWSFFWFYFFGSMWFLKYFSSGFLLSRFFNFSSFSYYLIDLGWFEYFVSGGLLGFINWISSYFIKKFIEEILYLFLFFFFIFFFFLFFLVLFK
uniref:NADH:ubiquinone reductase (H(+)-translocating) n=1 Tax=Geisha distinctissima TaxID=130583 RepID=C3TX59_9HEMI|nr:NADH dehydrogenase subunit 5 [Geisha distinctissima]ACI28658.1 NADH dehydrogenase subunit 5 [Geisha distinctissima]